MIPVVELHARWILGDGTTINFWKDRWMDASIANLLEIPYHVSNLLVASVQRRNQDFMLRGTGVKTCLQSPI
ncbi:hypothetical protein BVC80_609g4 [Macleaya cordata]|uniref:Reverse transcriptase zinc-binding domain n=1 Tax=Macleaya cordata TaxID=56857 RepID=A0A200R0M0_MACCD|nr:hypothetical protein BVC80_609g4 [Macleaya cordata]